MARQKPYTWFLTVGICAVISIAGLVNVYGDNAAVEAKAKDVACAKAQACTLVQMDRTPFSHTYRFNVMREGTVSVKCARGLVFFGDYACQKQ